MFFRLFLSFQYRLEIGDLTTELKKAYEQLASSLRSAEIRLRDEGIEETRQKHEGNLRRRIHHLQTVVDEHRSFLRNYRQRHIEELNRINRAVIRARETLLNEVKN